MRLGHRTDLVLVKSPGTSDESRMPLAGTVQPKIGLFDVDTPIYEGDAVEVPDPRGGVLRYVVDRVRVYDSGILDHIETDWAAPPRSLPPGDTYIINAPAAAVGRGARANHTHIQHVGTVALDTAALANALEALVPHLRERASTPEEGRAFGEALGALAAAKQGDATKAEEHVRAGGPWLLDVATQVGIGVAIEAVKQALGL